MADSPILPGDRAWKDASGRPLPVEFYRFLRDLVAYLRQSVANTADITALEARIEALEAGGSDATLQGLESVRIAGSLAGGLVQFRLQGDSQDPGPSLYYGTDENGVKGFHPLVADMDFPDLGDVPSSYAGAAGQVVAVKATEDGLEFIPAGGVSDGDKGDITVSGSGTTWTIDAGAVTYAKMQDVSATQRVLGRNTAGAGDPEEVTLSQLLDWLGSTSDGDIIFRSGGSWTRLGIGTAGQVLTVNSGLPSWQAAGGGGGGSPAGSNTQVQFNNSGSFGADSTFTFNSTTKALSSPLMWFGKGADIARAATTSIANATGNFVHLTGTTTITSFGAGTAGQAVHIRFAGAGTLTHNATSLILPGAANITTAANDTCVAISEGGSNWRVVSYTKANGQAVVVAGATVANWTTAISTASPNGTVPVASWTATNAATNVDAAFVAKGNGATVAQVPNSATSGGGKRGIYATDWQKIRGGSFQVASGNYSTIGGGSDNTAQGSYGTVAGGYGNNANQQYATVAGGNVNSAGDHGFVGGGGGNSCVSGAYGAIAGGAENTVDEAYGWIPGGYQATTRGQKGAGARASGQFSTLGDCQGRQLMLRAQTFNATQTELTLDGSAATYNNLLRLPDNSCFMVRGHIQARESATGDARQWEFVALIRRGSGAGTTAMNVACTPTSLYNAAGASTWAIAVDADTTNGSLRFRGTGQAAKTIRWQADIYACTELVG